MLHGWGFGLAGCGRMSSRGGAGGRPGGGEGAESQRRPSALGKGKAGIASFGSVFSSAFPQGNRGVSQISASSLLAGALGSFGEKAD